ncbi:MAG: uroporphyrinogen decarboxylase [Alphaproteobacteria bacterium]|nr:MAG: uroporphyrinogen decarboxylase [Alphaproteobacteria bacterium]
MRFIETLSGKRLNPPPIWIMRQAGRYLPEYRAIRQTEPDFISFCLNPNKACEVTIQPIKRYQFDASIIFSDILLIPWAMDRNVRFINGIGPKLDVLNSLKDIEVFADKDLSNKYKAVGEAVRLARQTLPTKTALIGFSGAPWTLMTYLFEGGSSRDFANTKSFLWEKPNEAIEIIKILTEKVAEFLIVQANQGVNVLMLFDSWASAVPASWRNEIIYKPHQKILEILRKNNIDLPFIGFPKGIGEGLINYANEVEINCIALDQHTDPFWANCALPSNIAIQGNLDPLCLVTGGQQMKDEISRIIDCFADRPHIFNLGHGVVPQTPPEHIQDLVDFIRIKSGE